MTTNEYMRGVKTQGWLPFHGKLWQRNYYEHVIREDESLNRIRPFDSSPGLGRELSLRIPPHGRAGRCHGLARGAPQYITDNPSRRAFDRENPAATSPEPVTVWRT